MDRHAAATAANLGQVLDPLLRWVGDVDRGRRGPAFHLTPRGAHEVRGAPALPHVKLHSKIWALLCGLRIAIETGIKRLDVRADSQLVIDQVTKNTSYHDDKMEA
jgi:hypothetical protein